MKSLLIVTALIELGAGLALMCCPSLTVALAGDPGGRGQMGSTIFNRIWFRQRYFSSQELA